MEPSSSPWRVFDAPPDGKGQETGSPGQEGRARAGAGSAVAANQHLAIAGVLGALAIGALAAVIAVSGAGADTVEGPGVATRAPGGADAGAVAGEIVVDVAGAVVKPGVYRLGTGARVGDAIEAAGGFSPRVDVDRVGIELNLAATLIDGAQVRVPSRDEVGASTDGGSPGGPIDDRLVNLNTASQAELEALPGIGPATAGKIIESRAGSPFRTVDELRARGLVGQKTFDQIRSLLTVG